MGRLPRGGRTRRQVAVVGACHPHACGVDGAVSCRPRRGERSRSEAVDDGAPRGYGHRPHRRPAACARGGSSDRQARRGAHRLRLRRRPQPAAAASRGRAQGAGPRTFVGASDEEGSPADRPAARTLNLVPHSRRGPPMAPVGSYVLAILAPNRSERGDEGHHRVRGWPSATTGAWVGTRRPLPLPGPDTARSRQVAPPSNALDCARGSTPVPNRSHSVRR